MGKKILLIDDDPELRTIIRTVLRVEGHLVLEADDGAGALELLNSWDPNLVLLDIHMPHIDGISVLEMIRERRPDLPVIICSGDAKRAFAAFDRGASDFISKPLELSRLRGSVEAMP